MLGTNRAISCNLLLTWEFVRVKSSICVAHAMTRQFHLKGSLIIAVFVSGNFLNSKLIKLVVADSYFAGFSTFWKEKEKSTKRLV